MALCRRKKQRTSHDQVVYVGGAVVSLYIDDPAADDVRPTKDIDISMSLASLAPANPWFAPGFLLKEYMVVEGQKIQILPLPYFLASKFSAYQSRGNNEPPPNTADVVRAYVIRSRSRTG